MEEMELAAEAQRIIGSAGIGGKVRVEQTTIPGVLRLLGEVISEDDRLAADQAIRSMDGVLDVIDDITLARRKK